MKKLKEFFSSSKTNVAVFVVAIVLILSVSLGAAYATSRVQMFDIGVTLKENGQNISWRDYGSESDGTWKEHTGTLLECMLTIDGIDGQLEFNKTYTEELNILNSGTINEYVRVSIYKYWVDDLGNKQSGLDPEYIDLHLTNLDSSWLLDEQSVTRERTVLYYNRLLDSGTETPLFADTLRIDGSIANHPEYDGMKFVIEVRVDAVQENNAEDAVRSAWGANVSVSNGVLSLR